MELPKVSATQLAVGSGAVALGLGLGAVAIARHHRKKGGKRKSSHSKSSRKNSHRSRGRRYTPHTAGKRRDTSRRRIRYTKKGQPYVIKADGRARFISMKSAKSSHSRKGGKY